MILRVASFFIFFVTSLQSFEQQKIVTLDYFFNNEYKKNVNGVEERFHYIWEDKSINGYSIWGDIFNRKGVITKKLETAPTKEALSKTDIYMIVDPDTWKETLHPNYMNADYAKVISDWVKQGGVLVMLTNDSVNAELHQFNQLAEIFGIRFTDTVRNSVTKDITVGRIIVPEENEIFKKTKVLYLKGISTITLRKPAKALLSDRGDIIMAISKYGKGTVFAVGDPWIYNE